MKKWKPHKTIWEIISDALGTFVIFLGIVGGIVLLVTAALIIFSIICEGYNHPTGWF